MRKYICLIGLLLAALLLPVFSSSAYAFSCPDCQTDMSYMPDREAKAADCTNSGSICYYCYKCKVKHYIETAPLGHNYYQHTLTKASCSQEGLVEYTCYRCGEKHQETVPALEHTNEETVEEPSCVKDGKRILTCTVCGNVTVEVIPATGHSFDVRVNEPTCVKDGERTYICTVCNERASEVIPAVGHSYRDAVSEPTCTHVGLRIRTCSVCLDRVTEAISIAPHSYGEWSDIKASTLFSEGYSIRICSECGKTDYMVLPRTPLTPLQIVLLSVSGALIIAICAFLILRRRKRPKLVRIALPAPTTAPDSEAVESSPVDEPFESVVVDASGAEIPIVGDGKAVILLSVSASFSQSMTELLEKDTNISVKLFNPAKGNQGERPSLVLFSAGSYSELMENTGAFKFHYPGVKLAAVAYNDVDENLLVALVQYGHLCGYCHYGDEKGLKAMISSVI